MDNAKKQKASYSASLPYPDIAVEGPDAQYAKAMLDNIGGQNSEMSAIALYFYDHLVTLNEYGQIAAAFHNISIVEMHHLEIFGLLAAQLGEEPRLWSYRGRRRAYWTPGYDRYSSDLRALIQNAIASEAAAIEKYETQIHQITDTNIVENLQRIILDEQTHLEILKQLYQQYA